MKLLRDEEILLNPTKSSHTSASVLYKKYGVEPPSSLKKDSRAIYDLRESIHTSPSVSAYSVFTNNLPNIQSKALQRDVHSPPALHYASSASYPSSIPFFSFDLLPTSTYNLAQNRKNKNPEYFDNSVLAEPSHKKYPLPLPDYSYKQRVNYEMIKRMKKKDEENNKIFKNNENFNLYGSNISNDDSKPILVKENEISLQSQIKENSEKRKLFSSTEKQILQAADARSYESLLDSFALHHILLKKGKTVTNTPEFESFARAFKFHWSEITATVLCFEEWAAENNIDLVLINGKKIGELSLDRDFMGKIGKGGDDILNEKSTGGVMEGNNSLENKNYLQKLVSNKEFVGNYIIPSVVNLDDIATELKKPGHNFNSCIHGKINAAVLIQSIVRRFLAVRRYGKISRKGVAASFIQRWYRVCKAHSNFENFLEKIHKQREKTCSQMQEALRKDLKDLKGERKLIIHIPSIGWDERIRKSVNTYTETKLTTEHESETPNLEDSYVSKQNCILFPSLQNQELSRLCDLEDPLMDVILICFFSFFVNLLILFFFFNCSTTSIFP
jgi:hypothetical protein